MGEWMRRRRRDRQTLDMMIPARDLDAWTLKQLVSLHSTIVGVMSLTLRSTPAKHNVCAGLKARLNIQLWRPPAPPHASQLTPNGIIVTKFILIEEGVVD